MANQLSMGALIACTILSGRALAPIGQIASIISRYQTSKIALEGLTKIMNLEPERPEGKQFLNRENIQGHIHFENVSFAYPHQKISALNKVSFSIKSRRKSRDLRPYWLGKKLDFETRPRALPSTGRKHFDRRGRHWTNRSGRFTTEYRIYRSNNLLFYGTVRSNIAFGAPWADDQAIFQAGRIAGVEEFTKRHPSGYDMPVGERGDGLSGGQAQSIAIARSLITNPSVFLMDEPTSSMDNQAVVGIDPQSNPHRQKQNFARRYA